MCPAEKIHVLDKLYSGMSYNPTGYEFNINKPIMIFNKVSLNKTHIKQGYTMISNKNILSRGSQEPMPLFSVGANLVYTNLVFKATSQNITTSK